eukprot:Opistho-2@17199
MGQASSASAEEGDPTDISRPLLDGADAFGSGVVEFEGFEVSVNIYDLISANKYLVPVGLGAFHTGVVVHGEEFAYGFHKTSSSGIYLTDPRDAESWAPFRSNVVVGRTHMTKADIYLLLRKMGEKFTGNSYSIIEKNCNHFTHELCQRICAKKLGLRHLNRPARLGSTCPCCVPKALQTMSVDVPPLVEDSVSVTASCTTASEASGVESSGRSVVVTSQPQAISLSGMEAEFGSDWDYCSFPPPKRSGSRANTLLHALEEEHVTSESPASGTAYERLPAGKDE